MQPLRAKLDGHSKRIGGCPIGGTTQIEKWIAPELKLEVLIELSSHSPIQFSSGVKRARGLIG